MIENVWKEIAQAMVEYVRSGQYEGPTKWKLSSMDRMEVLYRLVEEINQQEKLISALTDRVDHLEKLISSFEGNLPTIELVLEGGKWITLENWLKKGRSNGR